MCRYIYLFLLGSWWAGKSYDDDGLTQIATRADDDDDDDAPSEMITSKYYYATSCCRKRERPAVCVRG